MEYHEAALAIFRELRTIAEVGYTLAELGRVNMRLGRLDAANEALTEAENLLYNAGDALCLGVALCYRAHYYSMKGDFQQAGECLAQAKSKNEETGAGDDSLLGIKIAHATTAVEQAEKDASAT